MSHLQTTPPTEYPVTLAEAKNHCRVTTARDDDAFTRKIASATRYIENKTNRQLVTATWTWILRRFPSAVERLRTVRPEIKLLKSPVQSVTSIAYLDGDGVSQMFSASKYILDKTDIDPRICLVDGEEWPETLDQVNAVTVVYVAGFGAASAVPPIYKDAILRVVDSLYRFRSDEVTGTIVNNVGMDVNMILGGEHGACVV